MDTITSFNKNSHYKIVNLYRNGIDDLTNTAKIKVVPSMSLMQIQQQLQQSGIAKKTFISALRLFTEEGVEIYQDDIQFLKNEQVVYCSLNGEDYDSSSGLAHYSILSVLGQGGFGKVLLGQHKTTKQKVAIKIVNTVSIGNAEDIDMVFREAEMLKSLVHRNIVQIYNCFTLSNMQVVYVMEYLQGGELLQYLQKVGRISESEARVFFLQIADAIQYCHNQKLIHRDLKLENILLADKNTNRIKIVDFGIAGMATNFDVSKIGAGSLKYMAPELFTRRLKKIGPHIDIWSLGVILYGLVVGTLPFDGTSQQKIIESILRLEYSYPKDIHISGELKNLLSEIFNPDFNSRIRMSNIMQHPWCLGVEKDSPAHKKLLEKKGGARPLVVTVQLASDNSRLSNLNGGISRLGKIGQSVSKLSGGLSKLAGGDIDQLLKLVSGGHNHNNTPHKSSLKGTHRVDSSTQNSIVVPELFKSLVDHIVPRKSIARKSIARRSFLNFNQLDKLDKLMVATARESDAPQHNKFQKLTLLSESQPAKEKARSLSEKVTRNYASILEKFKSDFKDCNQRVIELKIDLKKMDAMFPKRVRMMRKKLPQLQVDTEISHTERRIQPSPSVQRFYPTSNKSIHFKTSDNLLTRNHTFKQLTSPMETEEFKPQPKTFNNNQMNFYQRVSFLPYKVKIRNKLPSKRKVGYAQIDSQIF